MSTSCGIEEDTWRTGTIVCGSVHIGWGVIVTIAAIVLMAIAHSSAGAVCASLFANAGNFTELNSGMEEIDKEYYNVTSGYDQEVCEQTIFLGTIIFGVVTFVVSLLFYIIPGALGVCGAQNKNTGLVCAFIVCLCIILVLDIAGIVSSFMMGIQYASNNQVELIISVVGIVLTVIAVVIVGNYRTAVKQEENTVSLI